MCPSVRFKTTACINHVTGEKNTNTKQTF
uniref:Uncharacterized protein n=1 Tax=Anguilla anguilla TaxID=7936 RepID=A0A0E9U3M7_ANGAN